MNPPDGDWLTDVTPLGPASVVEVIPATCTRQWPDGTVEHAPAVAFVFGNPDGDSLSALCPAILVPCEALHGLDDKVLAAAGEAIQIADRIAEVGVTLAMVEASDRDRSAFAWAEGDTRSTFVAGPAAVGERVLGILRRSTCTLCGVAIFGDVAERGACLACDPPVDDDKGLADG